MKGSQYENENESENESFTEAAGSPGLGLAEKPPKDDCCPICFGSFNVPCQTSCRHWFCATCILTFWNYGDPLKRCKCPICSGVISTMTIKTSIVCNTEDEEIVEALAKVRAYNCLFGGGVLGLFTKARYTPEYCRRFLIGLFDPRKIKRNYIVARVIALFLTLLYTIWGFGDFWKTKSQIDFIALTCMGIPAIIDFWKTKSEIDFIALACMGIPAIIGTFCSILARIF